MLWIQFVHLEKRSGLGSYFEHQQNTSILHIYICYYWIYIDYDYSITLHSRKVPTKVILHS